jgi:repressor of nif and glnA expression
MAITEQEILAVLRTEKRPLKAKTIAWMLRTEKGTEVTRTEVNRLLYAMKARGIATSDEGHFWSVAGEAKYGS